MTLAVDRATRVLLALAAGTPHLSLTELANLLDIPKPTVSGTLHAPQRHGLVVQDCEGGRYALGPAVLQPSNTTGSSSGAIDRAVRS